MIESSVNAQGVLSILGGVMGRMDNLQPALAEIGEDMTESMKRHFADAKAPDGTPWARNSDVTVAMYLGLFKNSHKKDGTLSKRGAARAASKKPGTGETKALQTTINYQLEGQDTVSIGSPMVYGAMFNYGGTREAFPHLWGDIPAREFAGFSDADRANIVEIVGTYIVGA